MKALKKVSLEDLIYIDIETVPLVPELEVDTRLFESFSYGSRGKDKTNDEIVALWPREAALHPEFGKVVCISVGRMALGAETHKFRTRSYVGEDEAELLRQFNEDLGKVVKTNRHTNLCGHAVIGFDVPFLFRRMLINGIDPLPLLDTAGLKPWNINFIDTKDLWQCGAFKPSSLIHITTAMDLPSPKDDINGAQVGDVYYGKIEGGLPRIAAYCEQDVIAVARILLRFKGEHGPLEVVESSPAVDVDAEPIPVLEHLFLGAEFDMDFYNKINAGINELDNYEQMVCAMEILQALAVAPWTEIEQDLVGNMRKEIEPRV